MNLGNWYCWRRSQLAPGGRGATGTAGGEVSWHQVGEGRLVLLAQKSVGTRWERGDREQAAVTGLTFLADDRIAVIDRDSKKCVILNMMLQQLGKQYRFQQTPLCVTCYNESNLACTLQYVLFFSDSYMYHINRKTCLKR